MGFLTRWIVSQMEDPAKRNEAFEKHMRTTLARAEEVCVRKTDHSAHLKASWNQPTKRDGFWRSDNMQNTYKFSLEPMLKNAPGRAQNW